MKSIFFKALVAATFLASFEAADAQIIFPPTTTPGVSIQSLNSAAIFPFGTRFNPRGKFAALGESGSVVGPTSTGCDLYGFRAQLSLTQAVNIGMQSNVFSRTPLPTISTNTDLALAFIEQNSLRPISPITSTGCGSLLGFFKQDPNSTNVFTLNGSITATAGVFGTSDRTLKRNIEPIGNALDIVNQLTGYTYEYRTDERPELNLPTGQRYGFITQEVQKVMPSIVRQSSDIDGNLADFQVMEYDAIIPVLAEAIKLQQNELNDLEGQNELLIEQNRALEARLARLEALILKEDAPSKKGTVGIAPSAVQLGQNRPNPTSGSTNIAYMLPENMTDATLVVFDLSGKQISSQSITNQNSAVEVNTSNWPTGTYVYSIVVDGRVLARKKMIVQ